ncbi:penicillin-binding transpeptidase domain-containing protein [Thermophagus sp. OGC60D27]|uniref:penicillin-binding transpeptidase domain-containing protein n=1 Tax=Thermophagus sp. OGC60D27 TaxID=3458415 RepID=UPI0040384D86
MLVSDQNRNDKLSGKTGCGILSDTHYLMWFVGYLEKDDKPYFFAMNYETDDVNKTSHARYIITKEIL